MELCIFQSIIHIFLPCVFHAAVVNSFLSLADTYELLRCKATFAICKHLKSADLLCKSLLSHVWRVPGSKGFSWKHERLFELLTLVSFYYCIIIFQWFIVKNIWCILRFLSQKRTPVKLCDWSPFQKGMIYSDSTVDVYWMQITMSFFNRNISFIPSFAYTSIPASSA